MKYVALCSGEIVPLLEDVADIVGDFRIAVDADGLHVRAMDASRICLVDLHVSKSLFKQLPKRRITFEVSGREAKKIRHILEIRRDAEGRGDVEIWVEKGSAYICGLNVGNVCDGENVKAGGIDEKLPVKFQISDVAVLRRIVEQALRMRYEYVTFMYSRGWSLTFRESVGDSDRGFKVSPSMFSKPTGRFKSTFRLDALKPLIIPRFKKAKARVSNDMPLKIEYTGKNVKLSTYLAPVIP